jgi:hypothetical protein
VNNVTIQDVTVRDYWGNNIELDSCFNCTLQRVMEAPDSQPLTLEDCKYITVTQCQIANLDLRQNSTTNLITKNQIDIFWLSGHENIISENNVTKDLFLGASFSNLIYENNFSLDFLDKLNLKTNIWDNGSLGNYWSDYREKYPNAVGVSNETIGNTPYVIDGNNVDHYPLMIIHSLSLQPATPTPQPMTTPVIPNQGTQFSPMITVATGIAIAIILIAATGTNFYRKTKAKKKRVEVT